MARRIPLTPWHGGTNDLSRRTSSPQTNGATSLARGRGKFTGRGREKKEWKEETP